MEKLLTPAELKTLQEFVSETLTVINYDDTGVTDDLAELAEVAAEILEAKPAIRLEDEPEDIED